MKTRIALGMARHLLTIIGGAMVAEGYADAETVSQIQGGVVALFGMAWSAFDKRTA